MSFIIRRFNNEDLPILYNMLLEHKKIGKHAIDEKITVEYFTSLLKTIEDLEIFICCSQDEIISYLVTGGLKDLPIWVYHLDVVKKNKKHFLVENNGLNLLLEESIKHWESKGVFSYLYIQPESYLKSKNSKLINNSPLRQTYTAGTIFTIPKQTLSGYQLIDKLVMNTKFDHVKLVRIVIKKDCIQ